VVPALVPVVLAPVLVQSQRLLQVRVVLLAQRGRESEHQLPVVLGHLAHLVVEPAVAAALLLSRQSFSAAMAGSTPKPRATYDPVPRSR